jgi:signal peptidase II
MGSCNTNLNFCGCRNSMKKKLTVTGYFLLVNFIFLLDRVTKNIAALFESSPKNLLPGVSLVYVKNRGISWGMFHAQVPWLFYVMTTCVALVIVGLSIYTYKRWLANQSVFGEMLVLTGAVSNLLDRIVHGGVIDFIQLSYKGWCFPVFNIADIAICLGVCMMFFTLWRE